MSTLEWTETLALQQPRMDHTHQEFVELMGTLEDSLDAGSDTVDALFAGLIAHTQEHFAQEERWMTEIGFAAGNCHAHQHAHVLKVLQEVRATVRASGETALARQLVHELGRWFIVHAQMMDASLVQAMNLRGYNPETGFVARPLAEAVSSCGDAHCAG